MRYLIDVPEIKGIMAKKGYNISTLARSMGVSRDTLSAFLHGRNPTYDFMCKLIDALSLDPALASRLFFAQDLRIA